MLSVLQLAHGPYKECKMRGQRTEEKEGLILVVLECCHLEAVAIFRFSTELKPSRHLIEPDLNFEGLMERFCDHLLSFRRTLPVL